MEKNINNEETRLFDLIESTNFSDLSITDRLFVESRMTEDDYNLQRRIMNDSSDLFSSNAEPIPLIIPSNKSVKTIPLYQALVAIAAVFIFFFCIWPNQEKQIENTYATHQKTVIKKEYVHDTLVKYITKIQTIEKKVFDTITNVVTISKNIQEEPKLLEASNTLSLLPLNKEMIATRGTSLKQDKSSRFILPVNDLH
jgi:hypothetical protein